MTWPIFIGDGGNSKLSGRKRYVHRGADRLGAQQCFVGARFRPEPTIYFQIQDITERKRAESAAELVAG